MTPPSHAVAAKPAPAAVIGSLRLAAGNWKLQRDSLVNADGKALSQVRFVDNDWLPATVPGTVLSSYVDAGAIADPNFSDNQLAISDSFFWADFWYRNEFVAPPLAIGQHAWLHFNGINWKAEVFFNGQSLGRIDDKLSKMQTQAAAERRRLLGRGAVDLPAAIGADSMAGMGCREATPSNSNFLAALHSSLEQAHEAWVGEL